MNIYLSLKYRINVRLKLLYKLLLRIAPLRDRVVFSNFVGNDFGDDPKYIALKLHELYPEIELYWVGTKEKCKNVPDYIKLVEYNSYKYNRILSTSKVWCFNIKNLLKTKKKKGQFYFQTWHATLGLKRVEKDVEDSLAAWYVNASKNDSKIIDLMYTNNYYALKYIRKNFWYDGKIIKCDSPRESFLLSPNKNLATTIKRRYDISPETKILLYAPTFRKDTNLDVYLWNYERILDLLEERFGGKFVMLLRLHPNAASESGNLTYSPRVIPATDYPDMQELLAVADVEINDYSATMFEFGLLTKRPVFLFAKDFVEYTSTDRSLKFSFDELPFKMSTTEDGLAEQIKNFNNEEYLAKVEAFKQRVGMEDHGHGAENFARIIGEFVKTGKLNIEA